MLMYKCYDGNFTDLIRESESYLQTVLIAKTNKSHRVYLNKENLIECLNIEKENQRVKVCLLE